MKQTVLALALTSSIVSASAAAAPCPGNADALGTERTLAVDAATTPRVGRKQFSQTLALEAKEVVLTFDDGPWPGTTRRILNALARECVKATFFMLGRNVEAHPELARAVREAGHVVGHHTYAHRLLDRIPVAAAEAISAGFQRVWPEAEISHAPIADGGEGFADALRDALGGEWVVTRALDPIGREVDARYAWVEKEKLAVIDMSEEAACKAKYTTPPTEEVVVAGPGNALGPAYGVS